MIKFFLVIFIILISASPVFTSQVFADPTTITIPPGKTILEPVTANKGQIIEIGFQVDGSFDDNVIQFWMQDSNGNVVYSKRSVDLSIEKISVIAANDDTYQLFFKNLSTAQFDDRKITLTSNVKNPDCGEGMIFKGGLCVENKGSCLIATAAFGSELAPQVQLLREVRDNVLFSTVSGTNFMSEFNALYYSFSPTVADWERQNSIFKEAVKIVITPMLSTLSILNYMNIDSEQEMLGYGIGIILLNMGMYFVVPAVILIKMKSKFR